MKYQKILSCFLLAAFFQCNSYAFGSIAVGDADEKASDASSEAHVVVTGRDTPEAAKTEGVEMCKQKGLHYCRAAVWFDACGAYASSGKNSGTGSGATEVDARDKALENCGKDCHVIAVQCEHGKSI